MPKHVAACFNNGSRDLSVWTFRKDDPDRKTRQPYKCQSWRCHGHDAECAKFDRRLLFARVSEAIARDKLEARGFVFLVLTLDREGTFSRERRWTDSDDAYRSLSRMSRKFFELLRRWMKRAGMRPIGREWISTVEAHRTGWPHVNFLIWSPALADYIEREQPHYAGEFQRLGFDAKNLPPDLLGLATRAHWGRRATAERARNVEQVINYMATLAGEAGQALSEIAKLTQLPFNAPQRFRRVRTGKGWLPPRRKDPDVTGSIIRRRWNRIDGTPEAIPVNAIKDTSLGEHIAQACYEEERLWQRERENAPALREALAQALVVPSLPSDVATPEKLAELAEASRSAAREAYDRLGTPLTLTVSLPLRHVKPPEPPATGPPEPAVELEPAQLELGI